MSPWNIQTAPDNEIIARVVMEMEVMAFWLLAENLTLKQFMSVRKAKSKPESLL